MRRQLYATVEFLHHPTTTDSCSTFIQHTRNADVSVTVSKVYHGSTLSTSHCSIQKIVSHAQMIDTISILQQHYQHFFQMIFVSK